VAVKRTTSFLFVLLSVRTHDLLWGRPIAVVRLTKPAGVPVDSVSPTTAWGHGDNDREGGAASMGGTKTHERVGMCGGANALLQVSLAPDTHVRARCLSHEVRLGGAAERGDGRVTGRAGSGPAAVGRAIVGTRDVTLCPVRNSNLRVFWIIWCAAWAFFRFVAGFFTLFIGWVGIPISLLFILIPVGSGGPPQQIIGQQIAVGPQWYPPGLPPPWLVSRPIRERALALVGRTSLALARGSNPGTVGRVGS
jgi:hypothetical protein